MPTFKVFHCQISEEILHIPTTDFPPHFKCVTMQPCETWKLTSVQSHLEFVCRMLWAGTFDCGRYVTMGWHIPPQMCSFLWGIWTPLNTWFLGTTQVSPKRYID